MKESQHVNNVQQKALQVLSAVQTIKATTPKGRALVKRAYKQLTAAIENLGRARTAEAQGEMRKG